MTRLLFHVQVKSKGYSIMHLPWTNDQEEQREVVVVPDSSSDTVSTVIGCIAYGQFIP